MIEINVIPHTITASAGANGSISPSGSVEVGHMEPQSFSFTPAAGYEIDTVLIDGISFGSIDEFEFDKVFTDHTISASFKLTVIYFTITSSTNVGGTISPLGEVEVATGTNKTFTMTEDTDYYLEQYFVDSEPQKWYTNSDDFNGASLDLALWAASGDPSTDLAFSNSRIYPNTYALQTIYSKVAFVGDFDIYLKANLISTSKPGQKVEFSLAQNDVGDSTYARYINFGLAWSNPEGISQIEGDIIDGGYDTLYHIPTTPVTIIAGTDIELRIARVISEWFFYWKYSGETTWNLIGSYDDSALEGNGRVGISISMDPYTFEAPYEYPKVDRYFILRRDVEVTSSMVPS